MMSFFISLPCPQFILTGSINSLLLFCIDIFRAVYIRTVNQLAEKLGSNVRMVTYDRVGFHNFYLILRHHPTTWKDIWVN